MLNRPQRLALPALAIWLTCGSAFADDKFELRDSELELVDAGSQVGVDKLLQIDFAHTTGSGKTVSGEGSLELLSALITTSTDTLYLGDGAQGNLSSLININAVNSQISVLLNLNINIESSVGSLIQSNIKTPVPTVLPPSR